MERTVRKFRTFEEAELAEREYYRSLAPDERLRILLELIERGSDEAPKRFERVYRVVKLPGG